ncbi:unnamed protein product [Prunus armeniaca]|uniref:Uncharacterized protein n=1 Tax=Prunus armeniaca TaxID=36596 RepID=A0A6J5UCA9_PRUAR|nr:unnamed protein product [Prunus armeniaca]
MTEEHEYYSGKGTKMAKPFTAKVSKHKEDEELHRRKRLEAWEAAQNGGRRSDGKHHGGDKPISHKTLGLTWQLIHWPSVIK